MKYGFSQFTGRLSAPSPLDTPSKFGKGIEGPTIQYPVGTTFPKTMPGFKGKYASVPHHLLKKMTLFQMPNNLPVHLKGGPIDKLLYGVTAFVCTLGFIDCFRVYYHLSYPESNKDE